MKKMTWTQPEIKELDVKETAMGPTITSDIDSITYDRSGNVLVSFS